MKVEEKPVGWFTANESNYRQHPQAQLDHLVASIERLGVFRPVVARPDGTLLAGHGVVEAAKQAGKETVPVYIFDGSDADARFLMVADNETSRMAEDSEDDLRSLLSAIEEEAGTLLGTGWAEEELAGLIEPEPPAGDGEPRQTLADRFGAPPFSVLDARQGYWQERKRAWLALGIQSELGRGGHSNAQPPHGPSVTQNADGTLDYRGAARGDWGKSRGAAKAERDPRRGRNAT